MNKIFKLLTLCILVTLVFSCKPEEKSVISQYPELNALSQAYDQSQNVASANNLIRELFKVLGEKELDAKTRTELLEYGLSISKDQNISTRQANFLVPLVKEDFSNPETTDRIYDLASIMLKLNKETVAHTLHKGLVDNFPNYEKKDAAAAKLPKEITDINSYLTSLGEAIFQDPDNTGINRKASLAYVDACEAYALVYPKAADAPEYLFKAAEVSSSLRTFPKSISLYDWILDRYPNYEKASTSLFLKGFTFENRLGDDDKAREIYTDFIKQYPDHDLVDDIQFLIENLGKTDEEILQMIEEKRAANQNQ